VALSGLNNNQIYYWQVRAVNGGANTLADTGVYWSFTTVVAAPGLPKIPVLLAPHNGALTTIYRPLLDWKNARNAYYYHLQMATSNTFALMVIDQSDLFQSYYMPVSDLTPNTTYYWRIRACNSTDTCSAWSKVRNFRTALPAPISLGSAGTIQNLRPTFTWDMSAYPLPAATSFTVQVAKNTKFTQIVRSGNSTNMSYTPTADLPHNLTLYWRVRANGKNGPSAWSAYATYTTGNPPTTPALVSPANNALVTGFTPSLDWKQSIIPIGTTFKSYQVEVATDAAFTNIVRSSTITSLENHIWVVGPALEPNTRYYWHIQACNTSNECSAWSTIRTFRTPIL
jgi:phosphodiesterase/alkaline phosphatase D-like protein